MSKPTNLQPMFLFSSTTINPSTNNPPPLQPNINRYSLPNLSRQHQQESNGAADAEGRRYGEEEE